MEFQLLKENVAAAYRIIAMLGLDDLTYTHISARLPGRNTFLIAPFGLLFEEVTPESLLEVSLAGEVVGANKGGYNPTGYTIHSLIYRARPEISGICHLHTPATIAVSAMTYGVLPLSQHALHFYDRISYHPYDSLAQHSDIGGAIVRDLGSNSVMLLRNHGSLTCGKTLHEALFYTHHLEQAARAQVMAVGAGLESLVLPSPDVCRHTRDVLLAFEADLGLRDFEALKRKVMGRCVP